MKSSVEKERSRSTPDPFSPGSGKCGTSPPTRVSGTSSGSWESERCTSAGDTAWSRLGSGARVSAEPDDDRGRPAGGSSGNASTGCSVEGGEAVAGVAMVVAGERPVDGEAATGEGGRSAGGGRKSLGSDADTVGTAASGVL